MDLVQVGIKGEEGTEDTTISLVVTNLSLYHGGIQRMPSQTILTVTSVLIVTVCLAYSEGPVDVYSASIGTFLYYFAKT